MIKEIFLLKLLFKKQKIFKSYLSIAISIDTSLYRSSIHGFHNVIQHQVFGYFKTSIRMNCDQ